MLRNCGIRTGYSALGQDTQRCSIPKYHIYYNRTNPVIVVGVLAWLGSRSLT